MNTVVLIGRLTKDVELRYIPNSGTAVASFTIAVDRNYKNKEGNKETDFIPVQYMGKVAENLANYIGKGSLVGIEGSLRVDKYQNQEGEKKTFTKVAGKSIQFLNTKNTENKEQFVPPQGLGDFQQIYEDDDIPF